MISKNSLPNSYKKVFGKSSTGENKYYDESKEEFVYFPRFGTFEVYADKMLIFSKLKSNLWPKHDKLVRILELIHHAKVNGGDPIKYSLEYRLQNEQDEFFVDTYKAVIVKALQPKRPGSNPHAFSPAY